MARLPVAPTGFVNQTLIEPATITIDGQASAEVEPDRARLRVGVEARAASAPLALEELARAADATTRKLRAEGVAERDIKTTQYQLDAIYPPPLVDVRKRGANLFEPLAPIGYHAQTEFLVQVAAVGRLSALIAMLIGGGANRIAGVAFSSSQEAELTRRLRGEATLDALEKARSYVGALGLTLGRVLEIAPGASSFHFHESAAPSAPFLESLIEVPIQAGTLKFDSNVRIRWEINQ